MTEELVRIRVKVIPDYAPIERFDSRVERLERPRVVKFSTDTKDAEAQVKSLQRTFKQTKIVPAFDHTPLYDFNRHLDLKEVHWKRLARIMAEPLIPATNISQAEALLNKNIKANIEASLNVSFDYRRLERAVTRGTRAGRKKTLAQSVIGGAVGAAGSVVTAPFKLAAFTFANASAGIFRGFFEKIGQDISGKRLSGSVASGIDKGVTDFSNYTARVVTSLGDAEKGIYKFIQTLLRTGDLTKAFEGYVEYGAKDFQQAFEKLQNLGTLTEIPAKQQKRKGAFILENFTEELTAYTAKLKGIDESQVTDKDRKRTLLREGRGFNDYLVNDVTSSIQPFVDTALDPLRDFVKPYLTAVSKIQGFNTLESAEKFKDSALPGLPGVELEKRLQLFIGGAQGVHGAGGHHIVEQLREFFNNHNLVGIENPDTDPKGQAPGWLQKLVANIAPDIGNNGAFQDTITNLQTQITHAINPVAQSRAAAEAIGTILAANELGYSDEDIAVGSYSLGGAELIRTATALELLNKNIELLAIAYPAANLIDIPKNFQSAVLDKDPLSSPIITGLFKQTERNRLLGDANIGISGSEVHGIHNIFKSPVFRQMFETAFQTTLPEKSSEAVNAGGEAYQILGALDQVKSLIQTGEFNYDSPYKSFATFSDDNLPLLGIMSQVFGSATPHGALGEAVSNERDVLKPIVIDFLRSLGTNINQGVSNTEVASQAKYLGEIQQYRDIRSFLQSSETDVADKSLQVKSKDPTKVQASLNQVENYLDWINKTFNDNGGIANGMKTMYENFSMIREGLREIVKGNVESAQAIFNDLPDIEFRDSELLQKVLNTSLDSTKLASPSSNRTLGTDAKWAKQVPQAIVAYNKMVQVLQTQMPDPDDILAAAYGMSGGTAFVAEDFVYKTDTRDGRKIASEGEVNALNRLGGRYSSALVKAVPGEAIVTERAPGQSIKDHLLDALEPLKMARKAYEEFASELEGQGQISPEYAKARKAYDEFKRNGRAALADFSEAFVSGKTQFSENEFREEYSRRETELEGQISAKRTALENVPRTSKAQDNDIAKLKQLNKAYTEAQAEFDKATEFFYNKVGRLEATLQQEGVAHNDLAAANAFYDPETDTTTAIDFGNANVDPTKLERFKDTVTTNLRVLADNDFWGFVNYAAAFKGLSKGRKAPFATQETRSVSEDALPTGSGEEIKLGTGTGEEFLASLSEESKKIYKARREADLQLIRNQKNVVSGIYEVVEAYGDLSDALYTLPNYEVVDDYSHAASGDVDTYDILKKGSAITRETTQELSSFNSGMESVKGTLMEVVEFLDTFLGGRASKILGASPLTDDEGNARKLSELSPAEGLILAKEGLADIIHELGGIRDEYDKQMEVARPFFRFTYTGWATLLRFAKELEDVVLPSLPYGQTAKEVGQKAGIPLALATGLSLLSPEAYATLHTAATALTEAGLSGAGHLLQFQTAIGEAIPALHPLTQLGEGALKLAQFISKLPFAGEIGEGLLGTASLVGTGKLAQKGAKDLTEFILPESAKEEKALAFLPTATRKLLTSNKGRANKQNRLAALEGVADSLPTSDNLTDLFGLDLKSGGVLSSKELQQLVTYVTGTSARKLQKRVGRSREALVAYLKNEKTYADELLFAAKLVVRGNADKSGAADKEELTRHVNKAQLLIETLRKAKERIAASGAELSEDAHVADILSNLADTRGKLQILKRSPGLSGADKRTVGSRIGAISTSIRSVDGGEKLAKDTLDSKRQAEQAKFIAKGYTEGVTQELPALKEAGAMMSAEIFEGFDEDAQIQSPSKKAIRKAKFIAEGLINGAYQSEEGVSDAYRQISKAIFEALDAVQEEQFSTPDVIYDTLEQIEALESRLQRLGSFQGSVGQETIENAKEALPSFANESGVFREQTVASASNSAEAKQVLKQVGNLTTGVVRTLSDLQVGRRDPNNAFYEGIDPTASVSEAMKRAGRRIEDVTTDVGYAGDALVDAIEEQGVSVRTTKQENNLNQLKRFRDLKARSDVFNEPSITQEEIDTNIDSVSGGFSSFETVDSPWDSDVFDEAVAQNRELYALQMKQNEAAAEAYRLHQRRVKDAQDADKDRLETYFASEQERIKETAHAKRQQENAKRLRDLTASAAATDPWELPAVDPEDFTIPEEITQGRGVFDTDDDPWGNSEEYSATALAVARIKAAYEEALPLLRDTSTAESTREAVAIETAIAVNRERDAILDLISALEQMGDVEELDEVARKLKDIQALGSDFGNETADIFGRDNRQNVAQELRVGAKGAKGRVKAERQRANSTRVADAANLGASVSDFISDKGNDVADLISSMGGLGQVAGEVWDTMSAFASPIFSTLIGQGKQLASVMGLLGKSSVFVKAILAGGLLLASANAVSTARQLKELRIQFQAVGEDGERALKKVFAQSQANGQSFRQTAELALGVTGALRFTRFEGEVDGIVNNFQRVATAMQLTEDQAQRFQLGLVQGFGKGNVSLEEVRQQIGEVVPQFIPTLARTQNLSVGQTIRAVSAGEIGSFAYAETLEQLAFDTQPAFEEGLKSLAASGNRWNNSITEINASLGKTPLSVFEFLAQGASNLIASVVPIVSAVAPIASVMSGIAILSFAKTLLGLKAVQTALTGVSGVAQAAGGNLVAFLKSPAALGSIVAAGVFLAAKSMWDFHHSITETEKALRKTIDTATGIKDIKPPAGELEFFSDKPKADTALGQFSDGVLGSFFSARRAILESLNENGDFDERLAQVAAEERNFASSGEVESNRRTEGINRFLNSDSNREIFSKASNLAFDPGAFAEYKAQIDELEAREEVLQARLTKISAGVVPGGKAEIAGITKELKEVSLQMEEVNKSATGTEAGIGGLSARAEAFRAEAKKLREENKLNEALPLEGEARRLDGIVRQLEILQDFSPLKFDLAIADAAYQDQLLAIEQAHNNVFANMLEQRTSFSITAEQLSLREAQAEIDNIEKQTMALDKLIDAKLEAFNASPKAAGLRELVGVSDLRDASFEQIETAVQTVEGGDNSEYAPFLTNLREVRELLREKGQKHLESARAAQREAEANVAYENSLRKVLNALNKVRAIKEGLDFSINLARSESQNAITQQFLDGNLSSIELDRELASNTRSLNSRSISNNNEIIAQSRAAIDNLSEEQRQAATRLLGGVDITQATMRQLNTVLAEYENVAAETGNNVVRGETVDGDIRGALEAAQFIWQSVAENAQLEGENLESLRSQAVTVTRGQLRSLNQRIREHSESIQDYVRGMNDRIEDLNIELFQIVNQNKGLALRNKLRRSIIGLTDSLQADVGEAVIDSVIQISEILSNSRVTEVGRQIRDNALDLQRQLRSFRQSEFDIASERNEIINGGSNDIVLGFKGVDAPESIESKLNERLGQEDVSVAPITEPLVKIGNSLSGFADNFEQSAVGSNIKIDSALDQFIKNNFTQVRTPEAVAAERYASIAEKARTNNATIEELSEARTIYINAWERAGTQRDDSAAKFDKVLDVFVAEDKRAIQTGSFADNAVTDTITNQSGFEDVQDVNNRLADAQIKVLNAEREKVALEIDGVLVTLETSIKEIVKSAPQLKRQLEDSLLSIQESIHNLGQMFKSLNFAEEMENQRREIARAYRDTTNSIVDFEKTLKGIGSIDPENTDTIKQAIDLLANAQELDPGLQGAASEASTQINDLYEEFLKSEDVTLLYRAVELMQATVPGLKEAAEAQHAAAKQNQAAAEAYERQARQSAVVSDFANNIASTSANAGLSRVESDHLQAQAAYLSEIATRGTRRSQLIAQLEQADFSSGEISTFVDQFDRLEDIKLKGLKDGLQNVKKELQEGFKSGLDGFLNGALDGLLDGDLNLGELALNFGQGLLRDIAQPGIDVISTNLSNLVFGKGLRGGGNPDFEAPLEVAQAAAQGKLGETPFERTSLNLTNTTNQLLQQQLQVAQTTQGLLASKNTTLPGIDGSVIDPGQVGSDAGSLFGSLFPKETKPVDTNSELPILTPASIPLLGDDVGGAGELDLSQASESIQDSVDGFTSTAGDAFTQGATGIIGAVGAIPGIINSFKQGDTLGGITGILGAVVPLFSGGFGGLFAYGGTVENAMATERAISGKPPMLAVVHEGEEILSTMTEDAQTYRALTRSGAWDLLKSGQGTFAYGGTVGTRVDSSNFKSNRFSQHSGDTTIVTNMTVEGVRDRERFKRTQTQTANRMQALQSRAARRTVNA